MHIVRLKAETDLNDLSRTLADVRAERGQNNRYALVSAQGEGQQHTFLVAADRKSSDWQLLRTAGQGSQVTITAKEANGATTEMSGKVVRLVDGRSFAGWAASYLARVLGGGAAFAVGATTALYGFSGQLQVTGGGGMGIFATLGLVAVAGVAATYPRLVAETNDRDYAQKCVDQQKDGAGVDGTIKSVETVAKVVAVPALPAPSDLPFVIPLDLAKTPVAVPAQSS